MGELFVLDTFAWVEYFIGSERGERVKNFIETNNCVTPTIVIAEISAKYVSENNVLVDMSEIAKAHALALRSKASKRFPSMLKNTLRALARSVFDIEWNKSYKMITINISYFWIFKSCQKTK